MSQKPASTKQVKVIKKLQMRQGYYDRFLKDWSDCHRPGGDPKQHGFRLEFLVQGEALTRLNKLGFGAIDIEKKLIAVNGNMSLGVLKATDYLVSHCGFSYTTVRM